MSELKNENDELRIEAEFFTRNKSSFKKYVFGEEMIDFSQYGTSEDLNEESKGFPVLRLNEFDSLFIDKPAKYCNNISYKTFNELKLKKDDVLICRTNGNAKYVGKAAIVPKDYDFAFASYLFRIRPKKEIINSSTLAVFLNSKYGRIEIERFSMQSNQVNFSPAKLRQIKIPILPDDFQKEIECIVKNAHSLLEQSKKDYKDAENLLLESLGVEASGFGQNDSGESTKRDASSPNCNIKKLSQSFMQTGRLDAEYYQDIYYEYEKQIEKQGFVYAKDVCSDINYGTVPTSPYTDDGSGIPYIKGMNLNNTEIITDKLDRIKNTEQLSNKFYTKKGDIIISQMGTVADVGVVDDNQENWIFASFTIRLRLKINSGLNSHYVGMFIQHLAKKYYFLRNIAQASVRQNTDLPTVKNLKIPLLPLSIQEKIASLVQSSFAKKAQSKALLQKAKLMVEQEIEK